MHFFDISKPWTLLAHPGTPAVKKAAEDFLYCINSIRKKSGLSESILMKDHTKTTDVPAIIFSIDDEDSRNRGFAWRAGEDRIEISGKSPRGLSRGIYDFLNALGFSWPSPQTEIIPEHDAKNTSHYALTRTDSCVHRDNSEEPFNRLVLTAGLGVKKMDAWLLWAFRNSTDAVVIPPGKTNLPGSKKAGRKTEQVLARAFLYGLDMEVGGWELSQLVPRNRFLFNKEIFRMEQGRRKRPGNFCPTNPDTIRLIQKEAKKLFTRFPEIQLFHLWPDRNREETWCRCPTCRAFSPVEQNIIGVNAAADILAEIRPDALVSYFELDGEKGEIKSRKNMFSVNPHFDIPGSGWLLAETSRKK